MQTSTTTMRSENRPHRARTIALAAGTVLTLASAATAGPEGAQVAAGSVQISQEGSIWTINASNRAIINYSSFDIGAHETVRFVQPGASSTVLNRIQSAAPTNINGNLFANGRVFIVNPAGVFFGANSVVNAAGIYAAGGNISNTDFLAGNFHFTNVTGKVISDGMLTGKAVHLIGQQVANHGTITSDRGLVTMLSGEDVLIRERGSRIAVRIDGTDISANTTPASFTGAVAPTPAVENTGTINAPRGTITLGAGDAMSLAIRNSGTINATRGTVNAIAAAGDIENSGTIDASTPVYTAGTVNLVASNIENSGTIAADAYKGRAGAINMIAAGDINLADGSRTSAAGGDLARGGDIDLNANGNITTELGSTLDFSGGARSGNAGDLAIKGGDLTLRGELDGDHAINARGGSISLGALDIVIGNGVGADVLVSDIENTAGDFFVPADFNITVEDSINKTNGALILEAGKDIFFGEDFGFSFTPLTISADALNFRAERRIIDNVVAPSAIGFGTDLIATSGDITLVSVNDFVAFNSVSVTDGQTVYVTQHDSIFFSGVGQVVNAADTNIVLTSTAGNVHIARDTGALGPADQIGSIVATSLLGDVWVERDFDITRSATLRAENGSIFWGRTGAFAPNTLTIDAQVLDAVALNDIIDNALMGSALTTAGGSIALTSLDGEVGFGSISAPSGSIAITQADQMVVGNGVFGDLLNTTDTALTLRTTRDGLVWTQDAAPGATFRSIDAEATNNSLLVTDRADAASTARFTAANDVTIAGDIAAGTSITLHAGTDNSGTLAFNTPALIASDNIALIAGDGTTGAGSATVNAIDNNPTFSGFAGGSPLAFSVAQETTLSDLATPQADQFLGGLLGVDYTLTSYEGSINLNADLAGTHLTLNTSGANRSNVLASQNLSSLTVNNTAGIGADIFATDSQTYNGNAIVLTDASLAAGAFAFNGAINGATAGGQALTINTNNLTLTNGVGQGTALAALVINANLDLAGGVRTTGDQTYNGALTLIGDANTTSTNEGTIAFASTIDGNHDLTVLANQGLISFGDNVGASQALANLSLSTNANASGVPIAATIVATGDTAFNADNFLMARGEKLTALGALTINATTLAQLGDLNTTGDLLVSAPNITIMLRSAADLLRPDNILVDDAGIDFVAGGDLTFLGDIALDGFGDDPRFGSATGNFTGDALAPFATQRIAATDANAAALQDQLTLVVLDQRVLLPLNPAPPADIDGNLLDQRDFTPEFEDSVIIRPYDLALLAKIGIDARAIAAPQAIDNLDGVGVYLDLATASSLPAIELSANRVTAAAVIRVSNAYDAAFGVNDATQPAVADTLAANISTLNAGEIAATDTAALELARLQTLLTNLKGLGLTDREYRIARDRILAPVTPTDLTTAQLGELIENLTITTPQPIASNS